LTSCSCALGPFARTCQSAACAVRRLLELIALQQQHAPSLLVSIRQASKTYALYPFQGAHWECMLMCPAHAAADA
jgi:hypothetical protein